MDYVSAVVQYIRLHSNGIKEPVHGWKIAKALSISDTGVRKWVNEARSGGIPICSCPSGYYYSEDPENINDTIRMLEGRIAKQKNAIDGLVCCRDGQKDF